jgi:hypothetical protein
MGRQYADGTYLPVALCPDGYGMSRLVMLPQVRQVPGFRLLSAPPPAGRLTHAGHLARADRAARRANGQEPDYVAAVPGTNGAVRLVDGQTRIACQAIALPGRLGSRASQPAEGVRRLGRRQGGRIPAAVPLRRWHFRAGLHASWAELEEIGAIRVACVVGRTRRDGHSGNRAK